MTRKPSFLTTILVFAITCVGVIPTRTAAEHAMLSYEPPPLEPRTERDRRRKWWREARFGMFIHWGLYAVPAGEYRGQRSTRIGEWIMEWANIPRADYEKFTAQFNPVKFNAAEW